MNLLVRIDNVLELNAAWALCLALMDLNSSISSMDLANAIDSTHNKLVKMAAKEQIWLKSEGHEKNIPDEFAAFITDLEVLAHVLYRDRGDLLNAIEESF